MRKSIAIFAASFYLLAHAGAEVLPAEKLLPDDTIVMVTTPDFNKTRDLFQNSAFGQLWNDPAMKDFREKFLTKAKSDYIAPLEHDLGIRFEDYTNLPQGQVTFAITQNTWQSKDGEVGMLFLIDTRDKSNQLKTNLADLKKKWVDSGKTVKSEKIRDIDFSVVILSPGDLAKSQPKAAPATPDASEPAGSPDKKQPKKTLYIGQVESLLIMGNSPKVIEKILVRMSGGSVHTLNELATFDADSAMFHDAPIYGWFNSKVLVDTFTHAGDDSADAAPTNPLMAAKPGKIMSTLGVDGLKSIAFTYVFSDEGALFNLHLSVPESSRTGLFKIAAGEPKDYNPPPFVPADAVKFQRWRLDGQKTYATLRKIVSDISPAGLGAIDFMLNAAEAGVKDKDPNFDLNKALFGNLGDDIISYSKNPKGVTAAELNSPPSIYLIGSPNPEQLANALKTLLLLYNQAAAAPTDREFMGHKIYSIPLPGAPTADGSPGDARSLHYASGGGYVAISTDNGLLEEYLRSSQTPPKPLHEMAGLSEATQKVAGSGTSLFGFSNEGESTRVLFDAIKKDPASSDPMAQLAPVAAALGMGDVKIKDWLDVTLLPSFDKISKYFYITVYAGSANADGINFKFFAPVPPQLKK